MELTNIVESEVSFKNGGYQIYCNIFDSMKKAKLFLTHRVTEHLKMCEWECATIFSQEHDICTDCDKCQKARKNLIEKEDFDIDCYYSCELYEAKECDECHERFKNILNKDMCFSCYDNSSKYYIRIEEDAKFHTLDVPNNIEPIARLDIRV